jgi:inhibitor of nuclear factor kappa-B kinase subunit alpha
VKSIVFSDEKMFYVRELLNAQNDRVYALSLDDIPPSVLNVQHFQSCSSLMVWAAISYEGKFPLVFISRGTKVNKEYYQEEILSKVVKPTGKTLFKSRSWTFQQDSAPSHGAKVNQAWCVENLPDFISSAEWPASSPDLNPMDFSIWGILQARVNAHPPTSLDSLKRTVLREWKNLSLDCVRSCIDLWRSRLKACVLSGGGRFE